MRYNLGCCSNTFLAGLFRRLCTVAVYCDFRARVLLCLLSCTATCALAYCHFCSRVLLFFALVCCYFLLSCTAIFCSRVPLFFGFRVLLCFALVCCSLCATAKSLLDMFFRCVLLRFGLGIAFIPYIKSIKICIIIICISICIITIVCLFCDRSTFAHLFGC